MCLFLTISICFALVLIDAVQFYASWKVYRFVFYLTVKRLGFLVSLLFQEDFVHISIVFFWPTVEEKLQDFKRAKNVSIHRNHYPSTCSLSLMLRYYLTGQD